MKKRHQKLFGKRFELHLEKIPKPFTLKELIEHMNEMAYALDGEDAVVRLMLTNESGTKQVSASCMSYWASLHNPNGKPEITLIAEIENLEEKIKEAIND